MAMTVKLVGASDGAKLQKAKQCQLLNLSTFQFHSSLEASNFLVSRLHDLIVAIGCIWWQLAVVLVLYMHKFTIPFSIASY